MGLLAFLFLAHRLTSEVSSFTYPISPTLPTTYLKKSNLSFIMSTSSRINTSRFVLPPDVVATFETLATTEGASSSTNLMLSANIEAGEIVKNVVIFTWLFGGLVPALISANKAMLGTLAGKRRGGEDSADPSLSVDDYVESSGATGPMLPQSALMFPSEDIPLVDIIAIVGRLNQDASKLCDWENLPSTKYVPSAKYTPAGGIDLRTSDGKPIMWLPRAIFKANVRKSQFTGWPLNAETGEPIGGFELANGPEKQRISKTNALIGDAALDVVFDSWANGASIATKDKVTKQLLSWRTDKQTFDLQSFTTAAIKGRAVTGLAAVSFIGLQILAFKTLIFGPIVNYFDLSLPF